MSNNNIQKVSIRFFNDREVRAVWDETLSVIKLMFSTLTASYPGSRWAYPMPCTIMNGLKAQQAHSPGQAKRRPGLRIPNSIHINALKGQKRNNMAQSLSKIYTRINASAISGRLADCHYT